MKKAYSHLAALALIALALGSCSRANYATNSAATPLAEASVAQAPAPAPAVATPSPAAAQSATVVAAKPLALPVAPSAPAVAIAPPVAPATTDRATTTPTATAPAATVATTDQPAAKAPKPTLVQRLALQKVAKQLTKLDARQQNTAHVERTAARSGSLTILLVGLIVLLLGILINIGWLTTIGAILAAVGLVLLLLKAL